MKKYKWIIILANLVIFIVLFNNSVFQKEKLLADGQLILLELAPVDPRSLMQGDYMRLNYAISRNNTDEVLSKRGYCIVKLGENAVAQKVRFQENKVPLSEDEFLISYTSMDWGRINIGAESFFFQEGEAGKYENAKYGGLKVDNHGNSLLVGLYDEYQRKIE